MLDYIIQLNIKKNNYENDIINNFFELYDFNLGPKSRKI